MSDSETATLLNEAIVMSEKSASPLVFISHDSRDAELAAAFEKLLKSVSAGMIKTFRSSDKKPGEGIDFGDEWYKRLMERLQSTSDVVCLFTERSLDRPWLLFEAGVAKGKLETPVIGIALGVPLARVGAGPFYQFQNMDDSAIDLNKLVHQLAKRIPGLELDEDVVSAQVKTFKESEEKILKSLAARGDKKADDAEGDSIAKLIEEMKRLPTRVAERVSEAADQPQLRKRRRMHPMMLREIMHLSEESGDPAAILMAASIVREEIPWLYELVMEVYRAAKSGDVDTIQAEMERLHRFSDFMMRGPFMDELGYSGKDAYMFVVELPRMLERVLLRSSMKKKSPTRTNQRKTT